MLTVTHVGDVGGCGCFPETSLSLMPSRLKDCARHRCLESPLAREWGSPRAGPCRWGHVGDVGGCGCFFIPFSLYSVHPMCPPEIFVPRACAVCFQSCTLVCELELKSVSPAHPRGREKYGQWKNCRALYNDFLKNTHIHPHPPPSIFGYNLGTRSL